MIDIMVPILSPGIFIVDNSWTIACVRRGYEWKSKYSPDKYSMIYVTLKKTNRKLDFPVFKKQ